MVEYIFKTKEALVEVWVNHEVSSLTNAQLILPFQNNEPYEAVVKIAKSGKSTYLALDN